MVNAKQQRQRQRSNRRGYKPLPKMPLSRPVPISRNMRMQGRSTVTSGTSGNSIRFKRRQMLEAVVSLGTSDNYFYWSIQPGLWPWIGNIAQQFDRWKLHSLSFHYVSRSPMTTTGTVIIAVDPDPEDDIPTSGFDGLKLWQYCVSGPIHSDLTLRMDGQYLQALGGHDGSLYVRPDDHVSRLSNTDGGTVIVVTQPNSLTTGTQVGDLWVEYDITLMYPAIPNAPGGIMSAVARIDTGNKNKYGPIDPIKSKLFEWYNTGVGYFKKGFNGIMDVKIQHKGQNPKNMLVADNWKATCTSTPSAGLPLYNDAMQVAGHAKIIDMAENCQDRRAVLVPKLDEKGDVMLDALTGEVVMEENFFWFIFTAIKFIIKAVSAARIFFTAVDGALSVFKPDNLTINGFVGSENSMCSVALTPADSSIIGFNRANNGAGSLCTSYYVPFHSESVGDADHATDNLDPGNIIEHETEVIFSGAEFTDPPI